jgi:hypothetical protein
MNEADKKHAQALVNRLLHEAGDKGAAGEYKHALTAVRKAKALDLTNVYTLALERQLEQMEELAITGLLTDAQKADILDSLPRLVRQAAAAGTALSIPSELEGTRVETPEAREARFAAGRWLKNQYFQRAHDFVTMGEYDHAILELRKIFSIDDQDQVAREFESKILQMLELKRQQPSVTRSVTVQQVPEPPQGTPKSVPVEDAPVTAMKGNKTLWIAISVVLIALILAALFFWNR